MPADARSYLTLTEAVSNIDAATGAVAGDTIEPPAGLRTVVIGYNVIQAAGIGGANTVQPKLEGSQDGANWFPVPGCNGAAVNALGRQVANPGGSPPTVNIGVFRYYRGTATLAGGGIAGTVKVGVTIGGVNIPT